MAFKMQLVCALLVVSVGVISGKSAPTMRAAACSENDDIVTCSRIQLMSFLDNLFQKDSFKVFNDVEVRRNGVADNMISGRSEEDLTSKLEKFVESRDVTFAIPSSDATVTYSPEKINENELNFKLNFGTGRGVEARKSKLKKIFIPILVFVLLKAMTLIPLALGVLGIKAWNALQLSFFAFITSTALAIFQLCKKIAADNHHPQIAAHGPWDAARSFETAEPKFDDAQYLAYRSFA